MPSGIWRINQQPSAFSLFSNEYDGECPYCRRRFAVLFCESVLNPSLGRVRGAMPASDDWHLSFWEGQHGAFRRPCSPGLSDTRVPPGFQTPTFPVRPAG